MSQDVFHLFQEIRLLREDSHFHKHAVQLLQLYVAKHGKDALQDHREEILRLMRVLGAVLPVAAS